MKGIITLFILAISLLCTNPVYAELHSALSALNPMPSKTGQQAEKMQFPLGYHRDRFYPLGFSRDGKFAYAIGIENTCGYCPAVVLFDPLNDKKLDSQHFEEEGRQLDSPALTDILSKWRVTVDNELTLRQFPADIRGNHIDVYLEKWELWIRTAERGSKRVADLSSLAEFSWPPKASQG